MRPITIALLAWLWLLSATTLAQSFGVSAEIVPGCALGGASGGSLDFGALQFGTHPAVVAAQVPASAVLSGTPVTLACTANLALDVLIDSGLHATAGQRRLNGGGAFVPYALYADAGMVTTIPAGVAVPVTVPPSGVLALPVYGLATLPGNLPAGVYTDTVNVTISW